MKLVTTLKDKLVKATATIRENRTEKCPLTSNDALKKQPGFAEGKGPKPKVKKFSGIG